MKRDIAEIIGPVRTDETDSEWGRLEQLQMDGLKERVATQSREAIELAKKCKVEVPKP